jgi:hypothetical protein
MELIYIVQLSGFPVCFEIGVVIIARDASCYHKVERVEDACGDLDACKRAPQLVGSPCATSDCVGADKI